MYDPSVGQFIEEDPIGFDDGGTNLYTYCENSPTNETDPSGLAPEPASKPPARPNVLTPESEKQWIIARAQWLKDHGAIRKTTKVGVIGSGAGSGGSTQDEPVMCEEQASDLINRLGNNYKFWKISAYNRTRTNWGKHGWSRNGLSFYLASEVWNVVRVDPKTSSGEPWVMSPFWGYQNETPTVDVYPLDEFKGLFPGDGDYDPKPEYHFELRKDVPPG
jgi:uncharacterized protein RhaS with RHS repeats